MVTPASGKSEVSLYIYYSNPTNDRIIPTADLNHDGASASADVKQIKPPTDSAGDDNGTMKITFLGAPSLTKPDTEVKVDTDGDVSTLTNRTTMLSTATTTTPMLTKTGTRTRPPTST